MVTLLSKLWIKSDNYKDSKVREKYGVLCGAVGIFLNVLLFLGKFFAGLLSGAISITADAFNNLSDAGSSFISMIGFKLSGPGSSVWTWKNRVYIRLICSSHDHIDGLRAY